MKKTFYLFAISLGILSQGSILRGSEHEEDAKISKASSLKLAKLNLQNRLKKPVDTQSTVSHSVVHDKDSEEDVKTSEQSRWHLKRQGLPAQASRAAEDKHVHAKSVTENILFKAAMRREMHGEIIPNIAKIIDAYVSPDIRPLKESERGYHTFFAAYISHDDVITYNERNRVHDKTQSLIDPQAIWYSFYIQEASPGASTDPKEFVIAIDQNFREHVGNDAINQELMLATTDEDESDTNTGFYIRNLDNTQKTYLDTTCYHNHFLRNYLKAHPSSLNLSTVILSRTNTAFLYHCDKLENNKNLQPIEIVLPDDVGDFLMFTAFSRYQHILAEFFDEYRIYKIKLNGKPEYLSSIPKQQGTLSEYSFYNTLLVAAHVTSTGTLFVKAHDLNSLKSREEGVTLHEEEITDFDQKLRYSLGIKNDVISLYYNQDNVGDGKNRRLKIETPLPPIAPIFTQLHDNERSMAPLNATKRSVAQLKVLKSYQKALPSTPRIPIISGPKNLSTIRSIAAAIYLREGGTLDQDGLDDFFNHNAVAEIRTAHRKTLKTMHVAHHDMYLS